MLARVNVILINGSFGVGKSTVARVLRAAWPGSAVYDPEPAGAVLWRLARWVPLRGSNTDDFQDMPAWRRSVVLGTRVMRLLHRGPIIVPMTFEEAHTGDQLGLRIATDGRSVDEVAREIIARVQLRASEARSRDELARRIIERLEEPQPGDES